MIQFLDKIDLQVVVKYLFSTDSMMYLIMFYKQIDIYDYYYLDYHIDLDLIQLNNYFLLFFYNINQQFFHNFYFLIIHLSMEHDLECKYVSF